MNKEEVLKELFQLPKDDLLDIFEILNGYKVRINKSKSNKDTLLMRCIFMKGYHNIREFYKKIKITKDNSLALALNYETSNIKAYLKLKNILNIDDEIFNKILSELERSATDE